MRELKFYKYQGTGNDFILINQMSSAFDLTEAQIAHLCDRRFGIGADGLMMLRKHADYDFEMLYYNSDGKQGSMCGNGGRCIVMFAFDEGFIGDTTRFIAVDGPHYAEVDGDQVILEMKDVHDVKAIEEGKAYQLDTGSPHYVILASAKDELNNIISVGKSIRYNEVYKETGINVNMLFQDDSDTIYVATYERGVEDETYSCGTGVTACALVVGIHQSAMTEVDVITKGGALQVSFEREGSAFRKVRLAGPAVRVFEGKTVV